MSGETVPLRPLTRGGLLDQGQAVHHRQRHAFYAYGEVLQRALGLGAPVGVFGDFDRPQAVCFGTAHLHMLQKGFSAV